MDDRQSFSYVYVHLETESGIRTKWKRIPLSQLDDWIKENPNARCYFATIQRFKYAEPTESEPHQADFYMDLDSEDLTLSLRDARRVVDYFIRGFGVESRLFFSGSKGFHIEVDAACFDAPPSSALTYHWRHVAEYIINKLELQAVDKRAYSVPRMWRIVNTRHPSSGLYKIPLDITELNRVSIDEIKKLAREPRIEFEYDEQITHPDLVSLYQKCKADHVEKQHRRIEERSEEPADFSGQVPPCVQYLLDNGLAELGTKNQADMALAAYCKDAEMSLVAASSFMEAWAKSIPDSLTHVHKEKARVTQSLSVLRIVYRDDRYHFSCGSILACGVVVDCTKCIVQHGAEVEVDLWQYSKAENLGKRIAVEADAIGKDSDELIYPARITGYCTPDFDTKSKRCLKCKMADYLNQETLRCERVMLMNSRNPRTLELLDVAGTYLRHRVNRLFGVEERCYSFGYSAESGNAQVVYLASRVSSDFKVEDKVMRVRALYLGHSLDLNRSYRFSGYVYSHPRTLAATMLIDRAEPLESSLATFALSKEDIDGLQVFKPSAGQTVRDKVDEIHRGFVNDFIYVFGREELLLAIDMVYHSVRWLPFQRQRLKGWLDVLVVGDTRQGKSEIAKKLMRYYNLGTLAAGETTSRTGLLYTIQMVQGKEAWVAFGLLPRANGYLVIVDEMHGMAPSDFREFTLVRSEGVVDVKRAAWGVAPAETRLVSIANAKSGSFMSSYGYPVEAIPDIPCFKSLEDISRFDYAVGVRSGDVDDSTINRDVYEIQETENPCTPELCKNLILWVWTRRPEDVIVDRATEKRVLYLAQEISRDYVPEIPLIESADVRHKIIRLAAAFAGRTYSTEDGQHLIVKPEHADAAYEMLNQLYKSPSLDYWGFSDDRAKVTLPPEKVEAARRDFRRILIGKWEEVAHSFIRTDVINRSLTKTMMGLSNSEYDEMWGLLMRGRFVAEVKTNRYRKTPVGREFFHSLLDSKDAEEPAPGDLLDIHREVDDF